MAEHGGSPQIAAATVTQAPPHAGLVVRGDVADERFCRAVASVLDVMPPQRANTTARGLLATLLWLGPDEWLAISETQSADALLARLRAAFGTLHASAVNVSDARVTLTIAGARARDALAAGCALDLHPRAFPQGACAQTLVGKTGVILHRREDAVYDLMVGRSYSAYLRRWLDEAVSGLVT